MEFQQQKLKKFLGGRKMKEFIKRILKSNCIGRGIYEILHKLYRAYNTPRKIKRLHKYGYEALNRVHNTLSSKNIPYYCEAGTMLGIVRDNGFIKHDDDIDIAIMPDIVKPVEVLKAFKDSGFGFVHGFLYEGQISEFTVSDRSGITIDVFFHKYVPNDKTRFHEVFMRWYADRKYPEASANTALQFNFRGADSLKEVQVNGVTTVIPTNAEEMLDSAYGPWRKPDPNFKSDSLKYIELPGFSYRITNYDDFLAKGA
jgi:hypothetical protein